jgi:hypothetical protein
LSGIFADESAHEGGEDGKGGALPEEVEADLHEAVSVLVDEVYNHGFSGMGLD